MPCADDQWGQVTVMVFVTRGEANSEKGNEVTYWWGLRSVGVEL